MAPIARKKHRKTGSHSDSKIYPQSAMLKRVELKSALYLYVITTRHCHKSILMPQYGFLASSCGCANMNSVKLKILPNVNGNFTMLIIKGRYNYRHKSRGQSEQLYPHLQKERVVGPLVVEVNAWPSV